MLRTDGQFTIYRIQHDYYGDGKWAMSNFDSFGTPPVGERRTGDPYDDCFKAAGMCWQETGVMGVYSLAVAQDGLAWIREKNPKMAFRLVRVYIQQLTVVIG